MWSKEKKEKNQHKRMKKKCFNINLISRQRNNLRYD